MSELSLSTIYLPVLFGIEAAVAAELSALGYRREQVLLSDGLATLVLGSTSEAIEAAATLNVRLRTAERVLFGLTSFTAKDFDALYEQALEFPFENWIEPGQRILVNGYARKSQLFGVPSIQRTLKKSIVKRLLGHHPSFGDIWPEKGRKGTVEIRFSIVSDLVTLSLDTTGEGLHKRGYRPLRHAAPIRETLAAAILHYSGYLQNIRHGEVLIDPMCGSGTFAIEAALMAANIAPGRKRRFAAEQMKDFGIPLFDRARSKADLEQATFASGRILGFDIDGEALAGARANATRARVDNLISFARKDLHSMTPDSFRDAAGSDRILFTVNPPYGERLLSEKEAGSLVRTLGKVLSAPGRKAEPGFRIAVISPDDAFEAEFGRPADRRRKLYNGAIRCQLFQYFRPSS